MQTTTSAKTHRRVRVGAPLHVDFSTMYGRGVTADEEFAKMVSMANDVACGIRKNTMFVITLHGVTEPITQRMNELDDFTEILFDYYRETMNRLGATEEELKHWRSLFTVFYNIELDYPYTLDDLKEMYNGPCESIIRPDKDEDEHE